MWRTTGWQATFDIDADLFALAAGLPLETTIDQAPTIDNRVTRLSSPTDPYNEVRGTFGHHFARLQD